MDPICGPHAAACRGGVQFVVYAFRRCRACPESARGASRRVSRRAKCVDRSGCGAAGAAAAGRSSQIAFPGAARRPRRCPCLFQPPRPPSTPEIGGLRALVNPLRPAGRELPLEAVRHFEPGAAISTMAPRAPATVQEAGPAEAAAARRTPAARRLSTSNNAIPHRHRDRPRCEKLTPNPSLSFSSPHHPPSSCLPPLRPRTTTWPRPPSSP